LDKKIKKLSNIIDTRRGIFSHNEKIRVKSLLHELVYSSLVSTSEHMLLRIEVASLIQDIIGLHEESMEKK
jgi:hypothetical protein